MHKIRATHTISYRGEDRVWEISKNNRGYYRLLKPESHPWEHQDIDWLVYAREHNMRIVPLRSPMEENE